jgi:protease PrsW
MRSALRLLAETFSPAGLRSLLAPRFWVLYGLAAGPVVLLAVGAEEPVAWLLFYFSLVWAVLFGAMVKPERGTGLLAVLLYTASVGVTVPLLVGFLRLPPMVAEPLLAADAFPLRLAGALGVGLREELFKLLPLAAVAIWRRAAGAPLTLRQGLALGAICGVAFAAAENVQYLVRFENLDRLAHEAGTFSQTSLEGAFTRVLLTPFMHGAWSGLAGFFLAWAGRAPRQRWTLRVTGVAVAAVLHAAYNVSAPLPWVVLLTILATLHLFTRCVARARTGAWAVAGAGAG